MSPVRPDPSRMTSPHLQKLSVAYEYPVYFTRDVFSPANNDLVTAISRKEPGRRQRLCAIIDHGVSAAWPGLVDELQRYTALHRGRLELAGPPLCVEGGEAAKNSPAALARVQEHLHAMALDRQSFVLIVGGGALLDMVGYAASITHRGLRVVRIPTTVLAQDDAGLSVKNGINAFGKKNFLGTFSPPFAVLNDLRFLQTLSRRDKIAGMAEAVKAALIRDARFFDWLVQHAPQLAEGEPCALGVLIRRSAQLHLDHIAGCGDPFEFGSARPLDFGHWAAHKLESLSAYELRHGEAVAIGLALDTLYSSEAGYLDQDAAEAVIRLLQRLGFTLWHDAVANPALLDGLAEFREHLGGDLTITLLKTIGHGFEVNHIDADLIHAAIHHLYDLTAHVMKCET